MPKTIEEILNETLAPEMKASLQEAFDAKLDAMREEIVESVQSDFAAHYESDKSDLVEALDLMVTDVIRVHEEAKANEIAKLVETRKSYQAKIVENKTAMRSRIAKMAEGSGKLIAEHLSEEVKSLRAEKIRIAEEADRLAEGIESVKATLVENHEKHLEKINTFVVNALKKELTEFAQDKRSLVETRVKLVRENKAKLHETQKRFIKEAASKVEEVINETLTREMTQLHEDIERSRQNDFGSRIFNAVAAEFMTSHLAEGTQVRKLQTVLESKEAEIAAKNAEVEAVKAKLVESAKVSEDAQRKHMLSEQRAVRTKIMSDLLSNLRSDKKTVMADLLESTKTVNLKAAFDRLLPVVLNEGAPKKTPTVLKETASVVTTGDRKIREETQENTHNSEIAEIVHLAGIRKN